MEPLLAKTPTRSFAPWGRSGLSWYILGLSKLRPEYILSEVEAAS